MDWLNTVVLEAVAKKVLVRDRILAITRELQQRLVAIAQPDLQREKTCQRKAALILEKVSALYEQIESRKLELEQTLADRIKNLLREREALSGEIALLRKRHSLPLRHFGNAQIDAFTGAVAKILLSADSALAKPYLRILVREVRVTVSEVRITGSNLLLATAVSKWEPGTPAPIVGVPSLISEWRARQDSNL
jgi:site-specific DNA recombinase